MYIIKEGINYDKTFAIVTKIVTIRTFLGVATIKNGMFTKWMYIMCFSMVIWLWRCTRKFRQVLKTLTQI